jgi:hypothetical protein
MCAEKVLGSAEVLQLEAATEVVVLDKVDLLLAALLLVAGSIIPATMSRITSYLFQGLRCVENRSDLAKVQPTHGKFG